MSSHSNEQRDVALTPDQERWAEALAVHRQYGDGASVFATGRIGALVLEGDAAGVARWREIALRLDRLRGGPVQ